MRRYEDRYDDERAGHGDFFMGAVVGAAVGAAVGLLFAPVRGRDAREMIGERVNEGLNRATATVESGRELAEKGRELVAQSKELVTDARETIAQAVAEGRDAYRRVKAQT